MNVPYGEVVRVRMAPMPDDPIKLLDVVALTRDLPVLGLRRGQVGAVVDVYAPHVFEVEFVDQAGRTYGLHTLHADQVMLLRHEPVKFA